MSGNTAAGDAGVASDRRLALPTDSFAWETVEAESARLGVSVEELVAFSVLYYLADVDSGRVARSIGRSPYAHPQYEDPSDH